MMPEFCWALDRQELVGKLVRRLAFDFDAVSNAFRDHLTSQGVDFSPDETDPKSLRKVFATLDRKRAAPARARRDNRFDEKLGDTDAEGRRDREDLIDGARSNSMAVRASREGMGHPIPGTLRTYDSGLAEEEGINCSSLEQNGLQRDSREDNASKESSHDKETGESTTLPSTEESWSFDSFLENQRRKEVEHDDQKEKLFHKVLSALGGVTEGPGLTAELPPEILQAWEVRTDKIVAKAEEEDKRRLKLEEDRKLALQRQSLKQRHLPGSEDCVGEDPLAVTVGCTKTVSASQEGEESRAILPKCGHSYREGQEGDVDDVDDGDTSLARCGRGRVGPVRIELGMDPEVLEKILDEHEREFALAAGGYGETNSELSRVLDELDEAAARSGNPATTAHLAQDVREQ